MTSARKRGRREERDCKCKEKKREEKTKNKCKKKKLGQRKKIIVQR